MTDMNGQSALSRMCVQVYTWTVFLYILLAALDFDIQIVVKRLNEYIDDCIVKSLPVQRTYLFTLACYSMIVLWFKILYHVLIVYVLCTLFVMMAYYAMFPLMQMAMITVANPAYVFESITRHHLPFHAVVLAATVIVSFVAIMLYVRNNDLVSKEGARSKFVRLLFTVYCMVFGLYITYALYETIRALM